MECFDGGRSPGRLAHGIACVEDHNVQPLTADELDRVHDLLGRFDGEAVARQQELRQPQELLVATGEQHADRPCRRGCLGRRPRSRGGGPAVDASSRPGQPIAGLEPAAFRLARGQFDDVACSAADGRTEGLEVLDDLDDDLIGVDESDVDREEHERRMDRPSRAQDDSVAGTELAAAEQAT